MFNVKELVANALMAVGKFLTLVLLVTSTARADVLNPSFGWFKKLEGEQLDRYQSSVIHALEYAELDQRVSWYANNASGFAVPVAEWPRSNGYCRHLHIEVIAFNQRKTESVPVCYNSMTESWTWYMGK